jgi:hypothetical protein
MKVWQTEFGGGVSQIIPVQSNGTAWAMLVMGMSSLQLWEVLTNTRRMLLDVDKAVARPTIVDLVRAIILVVPSRSQTTPLRVQRTWSSHDSTV